MKPTVQDVMQRVRVEVENKTGRSPNGPQYRIETDTMAIPPLAAGRIPAITWAELDNKANHGGLPTTLHELLALQGIDFLWAAYRIVLGRDVDPSGSHDYLSALHAARMTRLDVLDSLCSSPEGRYRKFSFPGLKRALLHNRFRRFLRDRIFFFSGLIRWSLQVVHLGKLNQRIASLESFTEARVFAMNRRVEELVARQVEAVNLEFDRVKDYSCNLATALATAQAQNEKLAQQLEELRKLHLALNHKVVVEHPDQFVSIINEQNVVQNHLSTIRGQVSGLYEKMLVNEVLNEEQRTQFEQSVKVINENQIDVRRDFEVGFSKVSQLEAKQEELKLFFDGRFHESRVEQREIFLGLEKALTSQDATLQESLNQLEQAHLNLNHVVRVEQRETLMDLEKALSSRDAIFQGSLNQLEQAHLNLNHKVCVEQHDEVSRLHSQQQSLETDLRQIKDQLVQTISDSTSALDNRQNTLEKTLLDLNHEVKVVLEGRFTKLGVRLDDYRTNLLDQDRRLGFFLQEARRRLPEPFDQEQLKAMVVKDTSHLDALYVSFEDQFRGTRQEIKSRVGVYISRIHDAGLGKPGTPIFDVGCGRGEWLEVLRENGLVARGVDLNHAMVAKCQELGLQADERDVLDALRELPPASVGVVSGFHIIEHLPLDTLISLFDEAFRVLVPGGFILFETPNPENLITSAYTFYFDPTHRHPLPPPLVQFLVEARGFCDVEIVRLHQNTDLSREMLAFGPTFNHLFASPQDYAVVARKQGTMSGVLAQ